MLNLIVPSVAAIYAAWLNDALISADTSQPTLANCATRCHEDTHNTSIAPENPGKLTENTEVRQAETPPSSASEQDIPSSSSNTANSDKGNCLQPTYTYSSTYTISDVNPARNGMHTSIFSNWMSRSQTASAAPAPNAAKPGTDSHKDHCPHTQSRQKHSPLQEDCPPAAAAVGLFTSRTLRRPDCEITDYVGKYFTNQLWDYSRKMLPKHASSGSTFGAFSQAIPPYIAQAASDSIATHSCNSLVNQMIHWDAPDASETSLRRTTLSPPPDSDAPASPSATDSTHSSPHRKRYRDEPGTGLNV